MLLLSRLLGVRWHVYDALVLPVLLGITLIVNVVLTTMQNTALAYER